MPARPLSAVTLSERVTLLNAPARYDDAQLLLDWVFGNFTWR